MAKKIHIIIDLIVNNPKTQNLNDIHNVKIKETDNPFCYFVNIATRDWVIVFY